MDNKKIEVLIEFMHKVFLLYIHMMIYCIYSEKKNKEVLSNSFLILLVCDDHI